ncbi:hypothetical protein LCGC14_1684110 [marine sediment metagenome]|uniref:5' nucleotidase, deoxy (Pyrimidine), cytosolic type C protein (NT5C) n=1 Tax=marine sediment metagenome TaxID=412755 RepID=A0A0F9HMX0_9ZZZZ
MIENIYLDMDGPLCQFTEAALALHNKEHVLKNWPRGEYDICKATEIDSVRFWGWIALYSPAFWVNLEPCPWARRLVDICREVAPTTIATSPTLATSSACGKLAWLQQFFDRDFCDYVITPKKHLLAQPGALLIDDCDAKCERFVTDDNGQPTGGEALVFPRPWNSQHAVDVDLWIDDLSDDLRKRMDSELY